MSTLPPEFIEEILTELPVKSLVRFLCVSKSCYALINDPDFIKKHLKRSIETNRERTLIVQDCERLRKRIPSFENLTRTIVGHRISTRHALTTMVGSIEPCECTSHCAIKSKRHNRLLLQRPGLPLQLGD
ncbi:hypothetical protein SLA2020_417100 [Shorea laevis]